ncbi:hypothetical protein [Achromobacter insuavis]|uniref:hypothetical protein n=1 Tax=Achromobacter insuavis TaxID=1287735 RepID=UPI000B281619|nr:hypothetical protein [Achromobacter insuavis]
MKNRFRTLSTLVKDGRIPLNFKLSEVKAMAIVGVDLVALMKDGSRLLLPGLAVKILERPSPELQFDDQLLSGAELFTKVDIDSTTLKDAAEALQVPISEPTTQEDQGAADDTPAVAPDSADAAPKEDGKGAEEPQAWYQEYGWMFGVAGLVGLALGLSGGKKGKGKEEDKPAAAAPAPGAGDHPEAGGGATAPSPGPDGGTDGKPVVKVTGGIAAGVFNHAQTLSISLYDGKGQALGQGDLVLGPGGQVLSYRAELPTDYVGLVRVVVSDGVRDNQGYIDEYRQALALAQGMTPAQAEQFAATDFPTLSAIGYRAEGQTELSISVTPLTELVTRLVGAPTDPTAPLDGVSVEQVNAMAAAVAKLMTQFTSDAHLVDILGPVVAINADTFAQASADAQAYGKVLAALAGMDSVSGALANTLQLLARGVSPDADGALRIAPTVEGAVLVAAMQEANALLGKLVDPALFDTFTLPQMPWAMMSATFTDAGDPPSPTLDALGKEAQPSVTVSWTGSADRISAGQRVELHLMDGSTILSRALTPDDVAAGNVVLDSGDYGSNTLGEDGAKRLFAVIVDDKGELIARSELRTYGLVGVEVDEITGLSADTGVSPSDFITNQPVQAVSGHYLGTLGPNTHIEVSADGGKTWVEAVAKPAADGASGGTWVSDFLRLDGAGEDARLLTRVAVTGVNGEQPLTLPGASHAFVLDVTPPEAWVASIDSISAPFVGAALPGGFLFTHGAQTIRGTVLGEVTSDDRIMVSIDGGATWTAGELSEDGSAWSAAVGFSKHGAGDILARISDVAGNTTDTVSHPYQYTEPALIGIQPTQAVQIVTVADDVGDPSTDPYDFVGVLGPNMSSDDRRPTFSGTLSAALEGDQVLVLVDRLNGGAEQLLGYANVAPPSDGQLPEWSFTPVSDMALGNHHVVVKVFSPGLNAFAPAYPEGVDPDAPDALSNWGSWDVNVQSVSFDGVIIPGVTSVNLLESNSHVTDYTRPILTGALGSKLAADEYVAIYDGIDGGAPKLIGKAEILPAAGGSGAAWRYEFHDDSQLKDGVHLLRAVVERAGQGGASQSLLSAGAPAVVVSTELPEQQVVIDRVMDDVGVYTGAIASGASTDDTKPSLSGTLSAPLRPGQGLLVRVEDANDADRFFSYHPVVDATGLAWSLEINPALPQGNYRLMAGVVNAGGAMGPRHADFNLRINNLTFSDLEDAAGPITGNVFAGAEPFLTDDKIPVLRGQLGTALGEGEALRIVSAQGSKETLLGLASLVPRGHGGFTWQLVLGASPDGGGELPDGHSTLSARVVDAASGQIRLAVDRVIDVDAGTPTGLANISEVRDQIPGNNGFVGVLAGTQSTDDRRPLISGMLAGAKTLPGSRAVQIVDSVKRPDGTVAENVLGLATLNTARNDGSWSFTPQESLALGDHTFSARIINRANGQLGPVGQTFTARESQVTINAVQDNVGALQGNLLDAKLFPQPPYTDDVRPQLSGKLGMPLGPNERVSVYDSADGGPVTLLGVATVAGTSWTFRPGGGLSNGAHAFQVRVERIVAGKTPQVLLSDSTPPITIDAVALPVTQSVLTLSVTDNNAADGSQTGPVPFRASTDDRKPVVNGTLSAALSSGQQVQVFLSHGGGAMRKLGVATMKGVNWTYTLKDALPDGLATIYARVVAVNSGLTSNTLFTSVNVNGIQLSDVTESTSGANVLGRAGHGTGDNQVTLHGKLASPLLLAQERVTIYVKAEDASLFTPIGVATIANGTDWSFGLPQRDGAPQTWQEGRYEVSARIEDSATRVVRAVARTDFTVDTLSPREHVEITGYQDQVGALQALVMQADVSTDDARGIVRGTLDKAINADTRRVVLYDRIGDHLVRLGEATVTGTDWAFQSQEPLVPGVHTFVARVENIVLDKTGDLSTEFPIRVQQVYLESIVDPAAPDLNILLPGINGASKQGKFTFGGHLGAPLAADEELTFTIDGVARDGNATVDKDGLRWSYTLPNDEVLADGAHVIVAQVTGNGGAEQRVVSASHTVYIDSGAPAETVTIDQARDIYATGSSFTGDNASGVSSDDALPLLKGHVSAPLAGGRSVAVYGRLPGQADAAFLGFASVNANADWTFQVDRELPFGDTAFTARVVNRADPETLRGPVSAEFIVHQQSLSITALVDSHGDARGDLFSLQSIVPAGQQAVLRTDDPRPTLSGRLAVPLKDGETVTIFLGKVNLGVARMDADGLSWSFTPQEDVATGTQRFSAVLLTADGLSRMSAQTPEIAVSALQPGNAVAITSVLDANNLAGNTVAQHNVLTTAVLDDARPRLSGTLAKALNAFEVLQVYAVHGGGAQLLGTATTNGLTWSLQPSVSLPAGASQLLAAIENKADGAGAVLSNLVDVNVLSPSPVSVEGVSAQGAIDTSRPTLRGGLSTDSATGLSVRVRIDGAVAGETAVGADGTWVFQPASDLTTGPHQVDYVLLNGGAVVEAVRRLAPVNFIVSGAGAPAFDVALTAGAAPIFTDRGLTLLTGTTTEAVAPGMGIMVSVDGKDVGLAGIDDSGTHWSYTLWAQPPGAHEVAARPVNLATLATSSGAEAKTIVYQNAITIEAPAGGLTLPDGGLVALMSDSGVTVSGKLASMLPAGAVLQVRRDGVALGTATVNGLEWRYSLASADQAAGAHQYSVVALPPGADAGDASVVSALSAQAALTLVAAGSGPSPSLFASITGLIDNPRPAVLNANATIEGQFPILRGTVSDALGGQDQIVVFGQASGAERVRLGVARMLNATTWEFQIGKALPQGVYTLIAMLENRLTGIVNDIAEATANLQIQHVAITELDDQTGVLRGNVLDQDRLLTDDATPLIKGTLSAPLRGSEQYLRVSDTLNGVTTELGQAQIDKSDPLKWYFQPASPLADGQHVLSVEVVVAANNAKVETGNSVSFVKDSSTPSQTATINTVRDDDGPIVGNVPVDGAIDYRRPLVSGKLSAALSNAQVLRVWQDDGKGNVSYLGDATVQGTVWQWRSDVDMAFGTVNLFATVDNAAKVGPVYPAPEGGVRGMPSPTFSFHLQGLDGIQARDSAGEVVAQNTGERQFTISGTLAAPLTSDEYVEVSDGARVLGRATVEQQQWHFDIAVPLGNGLHDFKISIGGAGNNPKTPLVFESLRINVHEAVPDPLQAGLVEAVIVLPAGQVLSPGSRFDTLVGQSVRPGQSLDGKRVGIFGTLAQAPRAGDQVQVFDNDVLLGVAQVAGTRWRFNAPPLSDGEHRFSLRINEQPVPVSDPVHAAAYPVLVLGEDAIRIDALGSRTDPAQALSGSLSHALGRDEVLGVYRTLNGETVRLGDATVQAGVDKDGRFAWSFTPGASLGLGVGAQILTAQVEGPTHTRIAAAQAQPVVIEEAVIATAATILSVSTPQANGLSSVASGATIASPVLVVSGALDRGLLGSERVALYDGDARVGYASVGANGRNWTYVSAGLNNAAHPLMAVVENDVGIKGPASQPFQLTIAAPAPGQLVTPVSVQDGGAALGSAVQLDTNGFSVFVWNMSEAQASNINNIWATSTANPTGQTQVPALNFGVYNKAMLPGVPYSVVANYVGSGWFHVSPEQAGIWTFRSPVVDDFEILSVDGERVMVGRRYLPDGIQGDISLDAGWHYMRVDTGNTGGQGFWTMQWRRPGETGFSVVRDVQTGPAEKAVALGATDTAHSLKLAYALSAPLGKDETLQVVDLTAHRTAQGLRVQFWNLPEDANRSFQDALALTSTVAPVVSRMADELHYDWLHAFDSGVKMSPASLIGRATGWFHVAQDEAGTWMFRSTTRDDQVQLKIDGYTLLSPDKGVPHAQFASMHMEAGWHYLDSTLFQQTVLKDDWHVSVIKPGQVTLAPLTGFAQFESAVLGNAVSEAADPTAFTFQATVDDGQSHTLLATVTQAGAGGPTADPMAHGEPGMVFLANGAFGIVDKKVEVIGDGQLIDFARQHGTVNMVDLDADKAAHVQGNTLVMDATDVRLMSDVGSAMSLGSALLDASFRQLVVQGGEHDVLRFGDLNGAANWQENGQIDGPGGSRYTVFTQATEHLQVIVDTHVALDLNSALHSSAHPVI